MTKSIYRDEKFEQVLRTYETQFFGANGLKTKDVLANHALKGFEALTRLQDFFEQHYGRKFMADDFCAKITGSNDDGNGHIVLAFGDIQTAVPHIVKLLIKNESCFSADGLLQSNRINSDVLSNCKKQGLLNVIFNPDLWIFAPQELDNLFAREDLDPDLRAIIIKCKAEVDEKSIDVIGIKNKASLLHQDGIFTFKPHAAWHNLDKILAQLASNGETLTLTDLLANSSAGGNPLLIFATPQNIERHIAALTPSTPLDPALLTRKIAGGKSVAQLLAEKNMLKTVLLHGRVALEHTRGICASLSNKQIIENDLLDLIMADVRAEATAPTRPLYQRPQIGTLGAGVSVTPASVQANKPIILGKN